MDREEAITAIVDSTGKTREQAEAFLDLMGSAFRRREWIPGDPLDQDGIAERLDVFLGQEASDPHLIIDSLTASRKRPLVGQSAAMR